MKRGLSAIWLCMALALPGIALAAEASAELEALAAKKAQIIEDFERASALAEALKAMARAQAQFRQVVEQENRLKEKAAAEKKKAESKAEKKEK